MRHRLHHARGPREAVEFCGARSRWHLPVLGLDGDCMPYLVLEDDVPVLLLFTTRRKANQALQGWIQPSLDMDVRSASCSRRSMAALLARLGERGLNWVRVNHGPRSVKLPLEAMAGALRMATHVTTLQPVDQLFLLRDPVSPETPLIEIVNDQPSLRLFTDMYRAQARATAMGPRLVADPGSAVVGVGPEELHSMLVQLRGMGVESVVLDGPGGGQWIGIDVALRDRLAA
ncbi:MAG: hypothetical protein MK101_00595 [Phycisphaerales bacterium]|nr:hypothetical protein [Phycisphaerales bacterium]